MTEDDIAGEELEDGAKTVLLKGADDSVGSAVASVVAKGVGLSVGIAVADVVGKGMELNAGIPVVKGTTGVDVFGTER